MKRYLVFAVFLILAVALTSPFSVSAKTKAETKPGSFFYFFDRVFEKMDLFFTFNPEKKAKKTLEYAEERLAEAEESKNENNQEAVKTAIENYQKNIQVLEKVLEKVPEEAKEAIEKVIEADKGRQEEITKNIAETKKETKEKTNEIKKEEIKDKETGTSKKEVEKTDNKLKEQLEKENNEQTEIKDDKKEEANKKDEQIKEIEKLKKEVEALKQKTSQIKVIEKTVEKPVVIESKQSSSSQTSSAIKQNENIVTLPNGAVVEMDERGNVVRTIKEVEATSQASTFKHVIVNAPQYVSREIKKGETNVSLMSLLLQSVGDVPVKVEEVNIRIVGPATVIKMMKIANCNISQSLNSKSEATLICPINIKNGSSNNYNIIADISDDISSENGKTIQVSVESIKAEDAVISGEFPIVSAPHKIIAPPNIVLPKATETISSPVSSTPTPQPVLTPAPSCTQDTWSCSNWNACSTFGNQTRSCTKTFDCSSVTTPTPPIYQSCTSPGPSIPLDITDNYSPALVSVALENSTAVAGSILGVVMVIRDDKNETSGLAAIEFRAPDGAGTIQQYEGYNNWNSSPVLVSRIIGDGYIEDTWRRTIKVPSLSGLWKGYRVDFADIAGNSVQFMSTAGSCTNVGKYKYPNQVRGAFDNLPCTYNLDLFVTNQ